MKIPFAVSEEEWQKYYDMLPQERRNPKNWEKVREIPVTVSLTSYPERIEYVKDVIACLVKQTWQPDRIVLYLAQEQFPQREKQLPEELLAYVKQGKLCISWCREDLKCHKKYFYAMQEYPDDLIITVDDDELVPDTMTEELVLAWMRYPDAVAARRVHLITISDDGKILPYDQWIKEFEMRVLEPSAQLMATGCAGVLYPPHLFGKELFDSQVIRRTCLYADDLWLKAMELVYHIPVVLSSEHVYLHHIADSQQSGLYQQNVDKKKNDEQMRAISEYLDQKYDETDYIRKSITDPGYGTDLTGREIVIQYALLMTEKSRSDNRRLHRTYEEKSELGRKLKKSYEEKSELGRKLQRTYEEKSDINRKLQQTYKEKAERGEKLKKQEAQITDLKEKIRDLGNQLKQLKESRSYKIGRIITSPFRKIKRK